MTASRNRPKWTGIVCFMFFLAGSEPAAPGIRIRWRQFPERNSTVPYVSKRNAEEYETTNVE
jgi:hypothetical protein